MEKILCIGEALIDMICTDKGFPLSKGDHFVKKAGGAPTNVAAAIAALGGKVDLAAKVGTDPFGEHLNAVLQSFGVGTNWLIKDPAHFTTLAFVSLMLDGERDFYFNRGADGYLSLNDLKGLEISQYATVHFGSATGFLPGELQPTYLHLLQGAKNKGCFISFDPNYRELLFGHQKATFIQQSIPFLQTCDFFKVSDEEALLLTQTTALSEALMALRKISPATFAITLGKEGTLLMVDQEKITVPSIPVEVVDTTGAGDAFVGALLFQLSAFPPADIRQFTLEQWIPLIANANKAGALTCTCMGAMEAFRLLDKRIFEKK